MQTREALICEPLRTPVGRFGGVFKDLTVQQLGAAVVKGLLERTGLPGEAVEDVLFAQCYPSMDAPALGRVVALDAGLPITTGGLQLDRRCGSGLQAVIYAALQVASGASDVVLAGGAESMSNAPFYTTQARWGIKGEALRLEDALARGRVVAGGVNFPVPGGMIETAENLRRDYAIAREEQDAFSVQSHARAVAAQGRGDFDAEIVPVTVKGRKGDTVVSVDEHPRPGTTLESLGALKPLMIKSDPQATVTAGNASGQNDGASVCVVASQAAVDKYGLRPFGKLVAWGLGGVPPNRILPAHALFRPETRGTGQETRGKRVSSCRKRVSRTGRVSGARKRVSLRFETRPPRWEPGAGGGRPRERGGGVRCGPPRAVAAGGGPDPRLLASHGRTPRRGRLPGRDA